MESTDHAATNEAQISHPNAILKEFLLRKEAVFVRLEELKKKGWTNPQATVFFENMRQQADNRGPKERKMMYGMMQQICEELHSETNALSLPGWPQNEIRILDLCMGHGGFSATALKHHSNATIRGISLPPACGGLEMLLEVESGSSGQIEIQFVDITLLATEFGIFSIPESHPKRSSFITNRPYHGDSFQLVFCNGQNLRNHDLTIHQENLENLRLGISQLILALQRIATGGTLVMLLHKAEAWDTAQFLYQFSQFSEIQLFKSRRKHRLKSSFYLVAKNVQPDHQAAKAAISEWKEAWSQATFGGSEGTGDAVLVEDDAVQGLLDKFGNELIELAKPLWEIQSEALIEKRISN